MSEIKTNDVTTEKVDNTENTAVSNTAEKTTKTKKAAETEKVENTIKTEVERKFVPGDMIRCRCVIPNVTIFYSSKTETRYEFGGYGDINEVDYADLQRLKASKSPVLYQPKILIEDEDLRKQWSRDLESVRGEYEGIYETDDIFNKDYDELNSYLRNASAGVKQLVKTAAVKLIKQKVLTDVNKIMLIDDLFGTKLKEFL